MTTNNIEGKSNELMAPRNRVERAARWDGVPSENQARLNCDNQISQASLLQCLQLD